MQKLNNTKLSFPLKAQIPSMSGNNTSVKDKILDLFFIVAEQELDFFMKIEKKVPRDSQEVCLILTMLFLTQDLVNEKKGKLWMVFFPNHIAVDCRGWWVWLSDSFNSSFIPCLIFCRVEQTANVVFAPIHLGMGATWDDFCVSGHQPHLHLHQQMHTQKRLVDIAAQQLICQKSVGFVCTSQQCV